MNALQNPVAFLGRALVWLERRLNHLKAVGLLSKFRSVDSDCQLHWPVKVYNPQNISLGKGVILSWKTWIYCVEKYGSQSFSPRVILDDKVYLGPECHIVACNKIHIESDVMLGNSCYISDNLHDYSKIDIPISKNPLKVPGEVVIGTGSWLGNHTCVFGDVRIGQHCVIGANSVVNQDIPDYSVAVGAPARIVKRYDFEARKWRRTDRAGNFIQPAISRFEAAVNRA